MYGTEYDVVIKQCWKLRKDAEESAEYGQLGEVLTQIRDQLQAEKDTNVKRDAAASSTAVHVKKESASTPAVDASAQAPNTGSIRWENLATKLLARGITLAVAPKSISGYIPALAGKDAMTLEPDTGTTLIVYTIDHTGEAKTHPKTRPPPYQKDHMATCISGVLRARYVDGDEQILAKDTYLVLDGGRQGPTVAIMLYLLHSFCRARKDNNRNDTL